MVEFVIVLLPFYLLIFGTIQTALIFSAKNALNYATFQAARIGSFNNATYTGIRSGLIRGLAPFYTHSDDRDDVLADINQGIDGGGRDDIKNAASEVDGYTRIIRISPRSSDFEAPGTGFGEDSDGPEEAYIPSDNLMYRSTRPASSGANIQDANLLKIRVQYCYELIVPMVNRVIGSLSELNNNRTSNQLIYETEDDPRFTDMNKGTVDALSDSVVGNYDDLCNGRSVGYDRGEGSKGFIIYSEAIVRMQSHAFMKDPNEDFGDRMCDGDHMTCPGAGDVFLIL